MIAALILELLTAFFFLLGAVLALLAAVGMLRLPDTFLRMQASAKASTLALACLLAGAAFQLTDVSSIIRLGAIAIFIMVTAPLSAHIVARASLHRRTRLWEGSVLNEYERIACTPDEADRPESISPAPESISPLPESPLPESPLPESPRSGD